MLGRKVQISIKWGEASCRVSRRLAFSFAVLSRRSMTPGVSGRSRPLLPRQQGLGPDLYSHAFARSLGLLLLNLREQEWEREVWCEWLWEACWILRLLVRGLRSLSFNSQTENQSLLILCRILLWLSCWYFQFLWFSWKDCLNDFSLLNCRQVFEIQFFRKEGLTWLQNLLQ